MAVISRKSRFRYILFNKPYGVLSQFTDSEGRKTLTDLGHFPKDVYSVGRLDYDSEGLLLLTNDRGLKNFILDPKNKHSRTYLVRVEKIPSVEALDKLRGGVVIEKRKTLPAEVKLLTNDPNLPPRSVPIRFRKSIPTAWLEITLREGRNRQVRKMTASVGHPTLRLVRVKIGALVLEGLKPGESRELTKQEIKSLKQLVRIKNLTG
jgi:23S rRNA pseudouridine2457 synthase